MIGLWGIDVQSQQDVVTLTAALAGLVWVYINLVRPGVRGLKHGAIVLVKTAHALGVLDDLPGWMKKHDKDRAALEAEVAIVHSRLTKIENVQTAIVRDLDIDVRASDPPAAADGLSEPA